MNLNVAIHRLTFCVFLILLFSCNEQENPEIEGKNKLVDHEQTELVSAMPKEMPVPRRLVTGMEENFLKYYIGNQNPSCGAVSYRRVQSMDIDESVILKLRLSDITQYIDFENLDPTLVNEGFAFHYVIRGVPGSQYFSYAITRAERNMGSTLPDTEFNCSLFTGATAAIVNRGGGLDVVPNNEYQAAKSYYLNNIQVYDDYPCLDVMIPAADGRIPKFTFFNEQSLSQFYQQNRAQITGDLYLYIKNGATRIVLDEISNNVVFVQTPILILGNDTGILSLDNNLASSGSSYERKAMDVGHLCPPDCNVAASCN